MSLKAPIAYVIPEATAALALSLDDPGFDASVLSEFRDRLLTHQAEQLFETCLSIPMTDHAASNGHHAGL